MRILHYERTARTGTELSVREQAGVRALYLGDTVQTEAWVFARHGGAIELAQPWELVQLMLVLVLAWLEATPARSRVLVVGLGGGSLPHALAAFGVDVRVHSIELEEEMLDAATRWFGLVLTERCTAEVAEAGAWLRGAPGGAWDVIVLDVFTAAGLADCVADGGGLRESARVVAEGGLVIVDLHTAHGEGADDDADRQAAGRVLRTLCTLFGHVYRFELTQTDNVLALCHNGDRRLDGAAWQTAMFGAWARAAEACPGLDLRGALERLERVGGLARIGLADAPGAAAASE